MSAGKEMEEHFKEFLNQLPEKLRPVGSRVSLYLVEKMKENPNAFVGMLNGLEPGSPLKKEQMANLMMQVWEDLPINLPPLSSSDDSSDGLSEEVARAQTGNVERPKRAKQARRPVPGRQETASSSSEEEDEQIPSCSRAANQNVAEEPPKRALRTRRAVPSRREVTDSSSEEEDEQMYAGTGTKIQNVGRPTREKKFRCSKCAKRYTTKGNRDRHERTHGKKRVKCTKCTLTFKEDRYMREHFVAKHTKDATVYVCVCGFRTTVRQTFNKHQGTCAAAK